MFSTEISPSDASERDTSGGKTSGAIVRGLVILLCKWCAAFLSPYGFPSRAHPSLALSLLPCLNTGGYVVFRGDEIGRRQPSAAFCSCF